ncbi:hypothetical protein E1H13_13425 [Nodosilinea sp. P-1105]|nr:hypothetical protein [Nodosilinea sp. P-1105]
MSVGRRVKHLHSLGRCVGGWVDGWMGGWVDGWMGGWVDGWMGGWVPFDSAQGTRSGYSGHEVRILRARGQDTQGTS